MDSLRGRTQINLYNNVDLKFQIVDWTTGNEQRYESESEPDSDDEIFAKFKTAEKIKEVIKEEGAIVNKFRYKGKLVDILEFKQKKKEKAAPKNISFSSWKPF